MGALTRSANRIHLPILLSPCCYAYSHHAKCSASIWPPSHTLMPCELLLMAAWWHPRSATYCACACLHHLSAHLHPCPIHALSPHFLLFLLSSGILHLPQAEKSGSSSFLLLFSSSATLLQVCISVLTRINTNRSYRSVWTSFSNAGTDNLTLY